MDATQTMSETARSSFLGDTMPHILAVRAFPPRRASLPAPTSHFWHSRAGDWDALAVTSDSAHLPRTFPTHPYPPPRPDHTQAGASSTRDADGAKACIQPAFGVETQRPTTPPEIRKCVPLPPPTTSDELTTDSIPVPGPR